MKFCNYTNIEKNIIIQVFDKDDLLSIDPKWSCELTSQSEKEFEILPSTNYKAIIQIILNTEKEDKFLF